MSSPAPAPQPRRDPSGSGRAAPADPSRARPAGSSRMGPRPAPAELGGGFTVAGATLLLTVLSAAGALVDALVFDRLVWAFGALFCLGCTWIALRLRRRDRRAAFVVPPLVYAAIVVVAALVSGDRAGLRQEAFDAVLLLSDRAPVLICGLVLVLVITVVRARRRHAG